MIHTESYREVENFDILSAGMPLRVSVLHDGHGDYRLVLGDSEQVRSTPFDPAAGRGTQWQARCTDEGVRYVARQRTAREIAAIKRAAAKALADYEREYAL